MDTMQQIRWASSGFKESYLGPKMGLRKRSSGKECLSSLNQPRTLVWFLYTLASEVYLMKTKTEFHRFIFSNYFQMSLFQEVSGDYLYQRI